MQPRAYYSENDKFAAAWLRNLIAAGHIAPGDVDDRSVRDVHPDDLKGYTQCHFFAGIGIWSAALRQIGWPDDRPVWTGSCPCQPFSAAGKRKGTADDRHLWPDWFRLIAERRPVAVLGEQVASKDGLAWLDLVLADLEGANYAAGAVDLCAAGVGAPHIRQRLWLLAYADGGLAGDRGLQRGREHGLVSAHGGALRVADPDQGQRGRLADGERRLRHGAEAGRVESDGVAEPSREFGVVGDAERDNVGRFGGSALGAEEEGAGSGFDEGAGERAPRPSSLDGRGAVNGFWRDADWIPCTDNKARPVESGTFPLAHGDPQRVGRLRAYGNALNQEAAAAFCEASRDLLDEIALVG